MQAKQNENPTKFNRNEFHEEYKENKNKQKQQTNKTK